MCSWVAALVVGLGVIVPPGARAERKTGFIDGWAAHMTPVSRNWTGYWQPGAA